MGKNLFLYSVKDDDDEKKKENAVAKKKVGIIAYLILCNKIHVIIAPESANKIIFSVGDI